MKVDNAIIIAAGFGSRFVPISYDKPKGLVEVKGEPLVERQIKQLREAGIEDIIVVTGYLAEMYDYLIDKYQVKIVYNPDYNTMNNFSSLYHARDYLKNSYILPSDIYTPENIYALDQPSHSWYALGYFSGKTREWGCSLDEQDRIIDIRRESEDEWAMYGPAFITKQDSEQLKRLLNEMYQDPQYYHMYWEDALIDHLTRFNFYGKKLSLGSVLEFESLDELRLFDLNYLVQAAHESLEVISKVFSCDIKDIVSFRPMTKGMTNRSFIFQVHEKDYVYRLPGLGTEHLISRSEEKEVYDKIRPYQISDEIIYFDELTGVKISRYYAHSKTVDPENMKEVRQAMRKLKELHALKLKIDHHFDLRERLRYYIKLCRLSKAKYYKGMASIEKNILLLAEKIYSEKKEPILCHIDAVYSNYLILENGDIKLIDWEYAGMGYPLLDVAMFGVYANYKPDRMDDLLEIYLERTPTCMEKYEFYSFIALSSYLWALWTVYKEKQGDTFGDYGQEQFSLAQSYLSMSKNFV